MKFGDKIKELRQKSNWTQADLAQKVGKTARAVIAWETNQSLPRNRADYKKLAEIFNVPEDYLLTESDSFVLAASDQYGYRGRKDAEELVSQITGLFSGGQMAEEDMDVYMIAIQKAYFDAKEKNKKYTPKKYLKKDEV